MWQEVIDQHLGAVGARLRHHTARYVRLRGEEWTRLPGVPEPLFVFPRGFWLLARFSLVARSLWREPVKAGGAIARALSALWRDIRQPKGRILMVDLEDDAAEQILYEFKKYHLFKNSRSRTVKVDSWWRALWGLLLARLAVVRGGICIVNLRESRASVRAFVLRSNRMGQPEVTAISKDPQVLLKEVLGSGR